MLFLIMLFLITMNIFIKFLFMVTTMMLISIGFFYFLNKLFMFYLFFTASLGGMTILYSFIMFLSPNFSLNFSSISKKKMFLLLLILSIILISMKINIFLKEFSILNLYFLNDFDCFMMFIFMLMILVFSMNMFENFAGPFQKFHLFYY